MTAHTDRSRRIRAVAVLSAGAALVAVAACSPVAGTATYQAAEVTKYKAEIAASKASVESSISSSRSVAKEAATQTACTSWRTNRQARQVSSKARTDYTKNNDWTWAGIGALVTAELAALATESGKLPSIIDIASPQPGLQTALSTYKRNLDAYIVGLRNDQSAQRMDWAESNPAIETMNATVKTIGTYC